MSPLDPIADSDPATRPATSRTAQAAIVVTVLVLLAARMPSTILAISNRAPADVVAQIGDARLVDLAMTVGAVLGLALTMVSLGIFLAVARLIERHLRTGSAVPGRMRVGPMTATVAACFLLTQARELLPRQNAVPGPVAAASMAVAVGVGIGLLSIRHTRRTGGAARPGVILVATAGLALATSLTSLPG